MRSQIARPASSVKIACPNCGYDLRGCPRSRRCPECGTAIDPGSATAAALDVHDTIERGGLDRLAPWLKGSALIVGGFLALQPVVAVGVTVCMMAVCCYRLVATRRFLQGGLAVIAPPSVRLAFGCLALTDAAGLVVGAATIAVLEFGPVDVRVPAIAAAAISWMSIATVGSAAVAGVATRRLLAEDELVPGGNGVAATSGFVAIGLRTTILVAIRTSTGTSLIGPSGWAFAIPVAIWCLLLAGLAASLLGIRVVVDAIGDRLIGDFVAQRTRAHPPWPSTARPAPTDETPIPIEPPSLEPPSIESE